MTVPGHGPALNSGLSQEYSELNSAKETAEDVLLVAAQTAVDAGVRSYIQPDALVRLLPIDVLDFRGHFMQPL